MKVSELVRAGNEQERRAALGHNVVYNATQKHLGSLSPTKMKAAWAAIGKEMGASLQKMTQAASELEQGRLGLGSARAREAMVSLNRTTALLRAAQSALNAAQSSTGLSEMLERLGAMAQSQMGVNQATEELFGKGELSMQDRAAMARLAAEQEALRQAVEDLAAGLSCGRQAIAVFDLGAYLCFADDQTVQRGTDFQQMPDRFLIVIDIQEILEIL